MAVRDGGYNFWIHGESIIRDFVAQEGYTWKLKKTLCLSVEVNVSKTLENSADM